MECFINHQPVHKKNQPIIRKNINPILKVISIFEYIKINTWLIINYYVIQIQHFDPIHFPLLSPFSG